MQGIYTYIPETNYVPREYSVAAILLLLFMVLISLVSVLSLLYFYISTFRSVCAVPIIIIIIVVVVSYPIIVFAERLFVFLCNVKGHVNTTQGHSSWAQTPARLSLKWAY